MTAVLVLDTATPATVVGVCAPGGSMVELRHDPAPDERPGHVSQVLELVRRAADEASVDVGELGRIGVGVGPGSFTGLRIGLATARALAQATGAAVVPVSTLAALAFGADAPGVVLAVLDARRGEAFVAAHRGGERLLAPAAVAPDALAAIVDDLGHGVIAVGDGAVRFRASLEAAGAEVPADVSERHLVRAAALGALTADGEAVPRDGLVPDYVRSPDAKPRSAR